MVSPCLCPCRSRRSERPRERTPRSRCRQRQPAQPPAPWARSAPPASRRASRSVLSPPDASPKYAYAATAATITPPPIATIAPMPMPRGCGAGSASAVPTPGSFVAPTIALAAPVAGPGGRVTTPVACNRPVVSIPSNPRGHRLRERQVQHHLDEAQVGRHVARAVVPFVRILLERPRDDVVQAWRQIRNGIAHGRRFDVDDLVDDRGRRVAAEWLLCRSGVRAAARRPRTGRRARRSGCPESVPAPCSARCR